MRSTRLAAFLLTCVAAVSAAGAQPEGTLEGRLTDTGGSGLEAATVELVGAGRATLTDADGTYRLAGVPAGTYDVAVSRGDQRESFAGIVIAAGETTRLDRSLPWSTSYAESITVYSASRRAEKITEAPAAVTVIGSEEIAREAAHGQIPKLLEFTPGVEVTQSGIYDYNLNTRGFNSSLNRRVATLIDGRRPSVPFLGAQEWAAVSFPLDDLRTVELVRGPSAALYGANASSGVLNLTTKAPRDSQGGEVRLTGGELATRNGDARWAGSLGGDWYLKLAGGAHTGGDFAKSRRGGAEYSVPCPNPQGSATDCLPQEATALVRVNDDDVRFGSLRLDKYFGDRLLTLEGGTADIAGPLFQTGIGRVQLTDVSRPWARANFNTLHWNLLGYYNGRDANDQRALASNTPLYLDEENFQLEAQTNWDLFGGRGRIVAGASYSEDQIDSANPQGRQTLVFRPIDADFQSVYAQFELDLGSSVKMVLAGRWDDSSLYDSQVSPKATLVWGVTPHHSLRLSYNEAFQVANYSELYLQANVAAPVNLAPIEAICSAGGVSCGFGAGPTRLIAAGNEDLDVETTKTWELGYTGILGSRAFVTLDYYRSENNDFITDLLPQLGTSLGRVNPNFGAYVPPTALPAPLAATLLATLRGALPATLFPFLSNNLDGSPIFVVRSYTNFGRVDTQGVDLALNVTASKGWRWNFTYSWFDFDIRGQVGTLEAILLPNSPEHKASAGVAYVGDHFDVALSGRWVDEFRWVVGPFQGNVKAYTTVDLAANYRLGDHWSVGTTISNATNNEHWEAFGGDLLRRRSLLFVGYRW